MLGLRLKAFKLARKVVKENPNASEDELIKKAAEEIRNDSELMALAGDENRSFDFQSFLDMVIKFIQMLMTIFA